MSFSVNSKTVVNAYLFKWLPIPQRLDVWPFFLLYTGCSALAFPWMDATDALILFGTICVLHALFFMFTVWFVDFKCFAHARQVNTVEEAEICKIIPAKFCGVKEIAPLFRRTILPAEKSTLGQPWSKENAKNIMAASSFDENETEEFKFEYRKQTFWYCRSENCFKKLGFPSKETLEVYSKSRGYGSEPKVEAAREKWGRNMFDFPQPTFWKLFQEQCMEPFFVFQVFCVFLWCLDDYWQYSLFTLAMLVLFQSTMANTRLKTLRDLRKVKVNTQPLMVHREGKWAKISGVDLLPGDLVSVGRVTSVSGEERTVPADLLLISGSVIVNEALLTGESTPQWKGSIQGRNLKESLKVRRDKSNVLFGGTKVVQHTPDKSHPLKTPDGGCPAFVLRTGFDTSQGKLMRTILFSAERVSANNYESGIFILVLVFFALIAAGYVLVKGLENASMSRFKLLLNCSLIITSVIPPELPMELTLAVNTSLLNLVRKGIYCTEPFRIPFAGKLDVCCFDKTGTLTSDDMVFRGVVEQQDLREKDPLLKTESSELSFETLATLACCHALVAVEGKLVGDPLELAGLMGTKWTFKDDSASPATKKSSGGPGPVLTVLQRHHFASHLKRMSVVVRNAETEGFLALVKGAPETIEARLSTVPANYAEAYKYYARQGGRVLALAFKDLGTDCTVTGVRSMEREAVESELEFAGFAVFGCPLRPDSAIILKQLKDSCHELVMITGDQALTACHVAAQVHISAKPILILTPPATAPAPAPAGSGSAGFEWVSMQEDIRIPYQSSQFPAITLEYDLCVTGEGLSFLSTAGDIHRVLPLVQVFARVSPDQKELILTTIRSAGYFTLMCGDGTNDVGALKQSHVGVALLNAEPKKDPAKKKVQKTVFAPLPVPDGRQLSPLEKRLAEQQEKWRKLAEEAKEMSPDGAPPLVQPGDASMASPFTARHSSVVPTAEVVRQGRAALVTTLQMFKILGLNCLISAYVLSALNLDGVKLGDTQATMSGVFSAVLFLALSHSRPLAELAPCKPYPGVLNPFVACSLLGQSVMHLLFLGSAVSGAKQFMPEECPEPSMPFSPNLVNTVSYTCQLAVQLATFWVNYAGRPFRESLFENKPFLYTLVASGVFFAVLAVDLFPDVRSAMELVALPQPFGAILLGRAVAMLAGCFLWDRLARAAFPVRRDGPRRKVERAAQQTKAKDKAD